MFPWMRPPMELHCKMHGPAHVPLWVLSGLLWLLPQIRSQLVFSTKPQHAVGLLGAPLTLDCVVYDLGQQTALLVLWEKSDGGAKSALVPAASEPGGGAVQLLNGSLFFPLLRDSYLGNYVCSAAAGAHRINATVRVEMAGLGRVFYSPRNQTVREGEAVFLQCVSGESSPAAFISWLKDGELVKRGKQIQGQYGGGHQKKTSGTLHIPNVTRDDGGVYDCVTSNPLLNVTQCSVAATLTVLGAPTGLQITQGPTSITVAKGTEAVMRCIVKGYPVPMVQWFKDDGLLTNHTASLHWQDNGQLLTFRNVSEEDEASYHCEASTQQEALRSQPALLLLAGNTLLLDQRA